MFHRNPPQPPAYSYTPCPNPEEGTEPLPLGGALHFIWNPDTYVPPVARPPQIGPLTRQEVLRRVLRREGFQMVSLTMFADEDADTFGVNLIVKRPRNTVWSECPVCHGERLEEGCTGFEPFPGAFSTHCTCCEGAGYGIESEMLEYAYDLGLLEPEIDEGPDYDPEY